MKRIITSLIIGCCLLGLLPVSLQAQKKGKDIMKEKVNFKNGIWKMAGDLYLPEGFNKNMKYAAVICVHPGGGVKEQTAGLYAGRLAENGFVALAFDAAHQGESEGEPRRLDSPYERVEDVKCAVDYLTTLPYIDRKRIGAMGVCAGGGYAINAALTEKRIRAVAGVSPVDAGLSTRQGWAGGNTLEAQLKLMEQIAEARTAEECQRIRQADIMETLMQHPDDNTGDHRTEDPGIDRLDPKNALDVIGFQNRGIRGWQNAFIGQPEVYREVHYRITDEASECRYAFIFACQAQRDGDTEHDRQETKSKRANLTHPGKDSLQHGVAQDRDQGYDIMAAKRTTNAEHNAAERQ